MQFSLILYPYVAILLVLKVEASVNTKAMWSQWQPCESENENCFKIRFLVCNVGLGKKCADMGDLYEETISIQCNRTTCEDNDFKDYNESFPCRGNCYDAIRRHKKYCDKSIYCLKTQFMRCYNPNKCSGVWTAFGTLSDCSASCGGGTQTRTEVCQEVDGSDSYNCQAANGTLGNTRKIDLECNQISCPVLNPWIEDLPCSVSCGKARRLKTRVEACDTEACPDNTTTSAEGIVDWSMIAVAISVGVSMVLVVLFSFVLCKYRRAFKAIRAQQLQQQHQQHQTNPNDISLIEENESNGPENQQVGRAVRQADFTHGEYDQMYPKPVDPESTSDGYIVLESGVNHNVQPVGYESATSKNRILSSTTEDGEYDLPERQSSVPFTSEVQ